MSEDIKFIDIPDLNPQNNPAKPRKQRFAWVGKALKMSKKEAPVVKAKKYSKSRTEHTKDVVIAVLVASIIAFGLGMRFEQGQSTEVQEAMQSTEAAPVEDTPASK